MTLNPETSSQTVANFLTAWPVSRIRSMTVADYANLGNHDSFCYWLEYGTKNLGEIGAISLNKFELWKPKDEVDFKDDRFKTDGTYAWNKNRGDNLQAAFNDVRNNILSIISFARTQQWKEIEKAPFHQIGKWKIAFLYSGETILPVYSKRALVAIANGLGGQFLMKSTVAELQTFILSHKPVNDSIVDFAFRQYHNFAKKSKPNYYIIGSKYGDDDGSDTIPVIGDFLRGNCVAIGFMGDKDFSGLMGGTTEEVNEFVDENWTEEKPAWHKIRRYFKLLSEIKAGDIIAVKSHGAHNSLTILAYAKVVERNGSVYENTPGNLGHRIHVEFLEAGLYKKLGLTYAETIHKLTPGKDKEKFFKVFGWYSNVPEPNGSEIEGENQDDGNNNDGDEGEYNEKTEGTAQRGSVAATHVQLIHNRIQNRFITYLKKTYPNDKPTGEKRRIDAKRENNTTVFIYEIKPSMSVYSCVREALGQLMDYSHNYNTRKSKRIIAVGPSIPDADDLAFINSIRALLKIPFAYIAFDEKTLTAEEF